MSTANIVLVVLAFASVVLNVILARYGARSTASVARPALDSMRTSKSVRASGRARARPMSSRGFRAIDSIYERSSA